MQGVHPAAKAAPTASEPRNPLGLVAQVHASLAQERIDAEDTEQVQPQRDDEHATDTRDPHLIGQQRSTQKGCGSAKQHEHNGEAAHEQSRVCEHVGPVGVLLDLLQVHAGDEAQVTRDQRKNTG